MKVLLRPNFQRQQALEGAGEVIHTLLSLGLVPMIAEEDAKRIQVKEGCVVGDYNTLLAECDLIMPIGGDGTVLHESLTALDADKMVLGINAGRLGFLSQLELSELAHLARLRDGNFDISKRMLIEVEIRNQSGSKVYSALNDIVINRKETNQILDISVFDTGGDRLILRQRADGIIFATPTGSTAYSMSAGGPIVSPEMEAILLTSIAPHTAFCRGLVLPTSVEYYIREDHENEQTGFVISTDGQLQHVVEAGEEICIIVRKSQQTIRFVDLGLRDFYKNLNEKLVNAL